ncbi:MAG: hypothetical protein ACOC9T_03270, partial [Myxococcota bacterium]
FFKTLVRLNINDDDPIRFSRPDFQHWADEGFPWSDGKPVMPGEEDEDEAEADEPAEEEAAPTPEPAPEPAAPKRERKAAPIGDDVLDDLAVSAFEIEEDERAGNHGRNAARYKRGELMIRLREISQATKRSLKDLLADLNHRTLALASEHSIAGFSVISETEASDMRKVVSAFGSSGEFRHVYGVNPGTGAPLVADDGKPMPVPLTEVAPNKLLPLVKYVDDDTDIDPLVSFAHSTTEKVVKKANSVAKRLDRPITAIINDITKLRTRKPSPLGPDVGEIEVPPEEKDVLNHLREMVGEQPQEDVATLRTSRGWYEDTWLEIKETVSAICRRFAPTAISETTNEVSNVFILERILTAFYHPREDDGVQRLLGVLVAAEEISKEQADEWVNTMVRDDETGEWHRIGEAINADDAEVAAGETGDDDEEGVFDDDFEVDTPTSEDRASSDPSDEEDF